MLAPGSVPEAATFLAFSTWREDAQAQRPFPKGMSEVLNGLAAQVDRAAADSSVPSAPRSRGRARRGRCRILIKFEPGRPPVSQSKFRCRCAVEVLRVAEYCRRDDAGPMGRTMRARR